MKITSPFLFAIVCILNFNQNVKADEMPQAGYNDERLAMQAAVSARNEFVQALLKQDYANLARAGLDNAIQDLANQLRSEQGLPEAADELLQTWGPDHGVEQFEMALAMSFDDLGDHPPLIAKLEAYFVNLEEKYGTILTKLPIVQQIRMVNFALPVVFAPASSRWQLASQDNRIEYRKHFIPFANMITYYASLVACNVVAAKSQYPQLKKLCKKAAAKLEFVMGRYVAPKISDFIYKAGNRKRVSQPTFTRQHLRYENGDDLSRGIRMGSLQ